MYMVGAYQHCIIAPDMDHVLRLRKIIHDQSYDDLILLLSRFQEELQLYLNERTWVLDFFGECF